MGQGQSVKSGSRQEATELSVCIIGIIHTPYFFKIKMYFLEKIEGNEIKDAYRNKIDNLSCGFLTENGPIMKISHFKAC